MGSRTSHRTPSGRQALSGRRLAGYGSRMSPSASKEPPSSTRQKDAEHRTLLQRYGPLRLLAPWACIIAGIGLLVRSTMVGSGSPIWVGAVVLAIGVIGGLVAMWMARRGL